MIDLPGKREILLAILTQDYKTLERVTGIAKPRLNVHTKRHLAAMYQTALELALVHERGLERLRKLTEEEPV